MSSSTPMKSPALASLMAEYLASQFGQKKLPSKIAKAVAGVEEESPLFEQSVELFKKSLVAPVAPAAAASSSDSSSDSSDSDSDSSSDDDETPAIAVTPAVTAAAKKAGSDSDSDSDSSEDEAPAKAAAAKDSDSSSDSDSDSDSDSSSDDSDSDSGKGQKRKREEAPAAVAKPAYEPAAKKRKLENGDSRNDEFNQANAGSNRVFVRNLSWATEEQGLSEMLQGCGTITDVFLLRDRETGRSRGSGFVTFETPAQAIKALELNETEQGGRTVHVNLAEKREQRQSRAGGRQSGGRSNFDANKPRPDGCDTVFVGGLPYEVDEPAVREHFADCGEIAAVRWVMKDGDFKGAGFVQFASGDGAEKAFKTKNGSYLGSRSVRLDYAADRRQSRGGY